MGPNVIRNFPIMVLLLSMGSIFSFAHVKVDTPDGGSYMPGSNISISWTETQDHGENNWDVYYSIDGGETWIEITLDVDEEILSYSWEIPLTESDSAKIKVVQDNNSGTDYEGISPIFVISKTSPIDLPDPEVITSIEEDRLDSKNPFALINYPNPFGVSTTIHFSIPDQKHVRMDIFNVQGKLVQAGLSDVFDSGKHEFLWTNQGLPNGVYLCRLIVGDQETFTKMLLRN